ncbi:MAG: N-6 DNA methylase [Myxococcaceae bacterium]
MQALDEESLADDVSHRRERGAYFTPAPLVEALLDEVSPLLPPGRAIRIVDPACGAGAFLAAAAKRFERASLWGFELDESSAARCRARVPKARIVLADALRDGLAQLPGPSSDAFEVWVGNPPFNGRSPQLRDKTSYRRLCAWLDEPLPRGTSLRDDFAFFLLMARERLRTGQGLLAFLTPSTLLDSYLYAPVRKALLRSLSLRSVLDLGHGIFSNARVNVCATVWTSATAASPTRYLRREPSSGAFAASQLTPAQSFEPGGEPDFLFSPVPKQARQLDERWRTEGEPLTALLPISLTGLKTRFDELLTDENAERLFSRVVAFARTPPAGMADFAEAHGLAARLIPKLRALRESLPHEVATHHHAVRPFYRYAGARHRGTLPDSARAYCYLDRAWIPRGDHRLRGAYDTHACPTKLLFNIRERPLSAALLTTPGCVHDYQHARFAPLWVPERVLRDGLDVASRLSLSELQSPQPNLSPGGRAWAQRLGGPEALFARLVTFINSREVQEIWAPVFGAARVLPVSESALSTPANR